MLFGMRASFICPALVYAIELGLLRLKLVGSVHAVWYAPQFYMTRLCACNPIGLRNIKNGGIWACCFVSNDLLYGPSCCMQLNWAPSYQKLWDLCLPFGMCRRSICPAFVYATELGGLVFKIVGCVHAGWYALSSFMPRLGVCN